MSKCSICGSSLDYDDYCIGENAHKRIRVLEQQLLETESQRDEAGRRYIEQVQECADKQRWIDQLESALRTAILNFQAMVAGNPDPFAQNVLDDLRKVLESK